MHDNYVMEPSGSQPSVLLPHILCQNQWAHPGPDQIRSSWLENGKATITKNNSNINVSRNLLSKQTQ